MSDSEIQPDGAGADQPFVLHTQYIKDLSFENPNAPRVFTLLQQQSPRMEVGIDLSASRLQDRVYEVSLKLSAHPKANENSVFVVELEYCGLVSIGDSVPEQEIEKLLFIEAPTTIFPFARRIIADATRDGGFPPLLINPLNFTELFEQRGYAVTEAAPASSEGTEAEA